MHLVSNVIGDLKQGQSAIDVLKATLPAGTLSGAPKVRAMEIIEELEPDRRGVYGGAIGYLSWTGNMDTAIAIRTAIIQKNVLKVRDFIINHLKIIFYCNIFFSNSFRSLKLSDLIHNSLNVPECII